MYAAIRVNPIDLLEWIQTQSILWVPWRFLALPNLIAIHSVFFVFYKISVAVLWVLQKFFGFYKISLHNQSFALNRFCGGSLRSTKFLQGS